MTNNDLILNVYPDSSKFSFSIIFLFLFVQGEIGEPTLINNIEEIFQITKRKREIPYQVHFLFLSYKLNYIRLYVFIFFKGVFIFYNLQILKTFSFHTDIRSLLRRDQSWNIQ